MDWIILFLIGSLFILMIVLAVLIEIRFRRTMRILKSQCPRYTYTIEPPLFTYKETRWEIPEKDDHQ